MFIYCQDYICYVGDFENGKGCTSKNMFGIFPNPTYLKKTFHPIWAVIFVAYLIGFKIKVLKCTLLKYLLGFSKPSYYE